MQLTPRLINFLMAAFCAGLIAFALYLQYAQNLEPCPLCMSQRVCFIATGLIALLAALHNPQNLGRKIYAGLAIASSTLGLWTAARQVWLQHLPEDKVPACGPGLEFMFEMFPFFDIVKTMLMGDGNCAEVVWTFLGLSIPEWSLLCFAALIVGSVLTVFVGGSGILKQVQDDEKFRMTKQVQDDGLEPSKQS